MNLAVKIAVFLVTGGIVGAISFFLFAFMLLAMNGYSESDAEYGLVLFVIWAVVVTVVAGVFAVLGAHLLEKRHQFHFATSALISCVIFIVIGSVANCIGVGCGILVSEIVRTNF